MRFLYLTFVFLLIGVNARADVPVAEAAKLLPDKIGNYTAVSSAKPEPATNAEDFKIIAAASRKYRNAKGANIMVSLWRTASDNAAYSLLQQRAMAHRLLFQRERKEITFGTQGFGFAKGEGLESEANFFQGQAFVHLETSGTYQELQDFGQKFASILDKGEGEVPTLVKHLPDWENAQKSALYAVTPTALNAYAKNAPALSAVSFEGGTEAVIAPYGDAQMVIVEFSTPQLATANDAAIQNKIKELQAAGQPVPTAYKREGNYGVFVFNAPDEAAAQNLISQVKYEKTVQWLGENPNILIRAQKRYVAIASGVFVSVMKASGLAILLALGVGGLIGALVFRRRRAQGLQAAAYSDAGGMMRLNLDEMTPAETNPARLLETKEI